MVGLQGIRKGQYGGLGVSVIFNVFVSSLSENHVIILFSYLYICLTASSLLICHLNISMVHGNKKNRIFLLAECMFS